MAVKVKKAKENNKIEVDKVENESEEAVIEVKTTKKPTEGISSFSQLDTDKKAAMEDEESDKEEESGNESESEEEKGDDQIASAQKNID